MTAFWGLGMLGHTVAAARRHPATGGGRVLRGDRPRGHERGGPAHSRGGPSPGHLALADVISMPDEWEYPWFATWDLAFHCVAIAHMDPDFAKEQLVLMCEDRGRAVHRPGRHADARPHPPASSLARTRSVSSTSRPARSRRRELHHRDDDLRRRRSHAEARRRLVRTARRSRPQERGRCARRWGGATAPASCACPRRSRRRSRRRRWPAPPGPAGASPSARRGARGRS